MDIIFFGTPNFAVACLKAVSASSHNIKAVVTQIDRPNRRGHNVVPTPIKSYAQDIGFPVIAQQDLNCSMFHQKLKEYNADIYVVVAFRILPQVILDIPLRGVINLHASLLPELRGAAPIENAILKGYKKTGCTVIQLNNKMDSGYIWGQQVLSILPNETSGRLSKRLQLLGSRLLVSTLDLIEKGDSQPYSQKEDRVTYAPRIIKRHCLLPLKASMSVIDRHIRAYSPLPGAWAYFKGRKIMIYECQLTEQNTCIAPCSFFSHRKRLYLSCIDGVLEIKKLKIEGKFIISGSDFVLGYLKQQYQLLTSEKNGYFRSNL